MRSLVVRIESGEKHCEKCRFLNGPEVKGVLLPQFDFETKCVIYGKLVPDKGFWNPAMFRHVDCVAAEMKTGETQPVPK